MSKPEFKLQFKTTSDAFIDTWGHEPARILREIAAGLDAGITDGDVIVDGKKIGSWSFSNPQLKEEYG